GRLEYVVGAADVGEVAVVVAGGHVAGVVVATAHRLGVPLGVAPVAGHQPQRAVRQVQADLALGRWLAGDGVDEDHGVTGQGAAHRAKLDGLAGSVADLGGGLGLAVAVPDGDVPGPADLLDHLGVERLAGREAFAQRGGVGRAEVGLDE